MSYDDGSDSGDGIDLVYFSPSVAAALAVLNQDPETLFGLCPRCPAAMWTQRAKDEDELASPYFLLRAKCRVLGDDLIAEYAVNTATLDRVMPLTQVVTACDMYHGELALWREAQAERDGGRGSGA